MLQLGQSGESALSRGIGESLWLVGHVGGLAVACLGDGWEEREEEVKERGGTGGKFRVRKERQERDRENKSDK